MGWQRPGASLTDIHTFTTHYMVNNEEGSHHHHCRPLTEQNKNSQKYITRTIFVKYSFRGNKQLGSGESAPYESTVKGKENRFSGTLSAFSVSCQDGTYDIPVCFL